MTARASDAIDVFRNLCRGKAAPPIIALILPEESKLVPGLLRTGIRGYLLNSCSPDQLKRAVAVVRDGEIYFSPLATEATEQAVTNGQGKTPRSEVDILTETERKVARLVASEFRDKEIADRLKISLRTAQTHRATLMRKLKVRSAAGLTKFAIRTGLTSLD